MANLQTQMFFVLLLLSGISAMSQDLPDDQKSVDRRNYPAIDEFEGYWNVAPKKTHRDKHFGNSDDHYRYSEPDGRTSISVEEIQAISKFIGNVESKLEPTTVKPIRQRGDATTHFFQSDRTVAIEFFDHGQFTKANVELFRQELANHHPLWRIKFAVSDLKLVPVVYPSCIVLPRAWQGNESEYWAHLKWFLEAEFEASQKRFIELQEDIVKALLKKHSSRASDANTVEVFPIAAFQREYDDSNSTRRELYVWLVTDNLHPGKSHLVKGLPKLKSYLGYYAQFGLVANGELVKHHWGYSEEDDRGFLKRVYLLCFDLETFDGKFRLFDPERNQEVEMILDDKLEFWDKSTATELLDKLK